MPGIERESNGRVYWVKEFVESLKEKERVEGGENGEAQESKETEEYQLKGFVSRTKPHASSGRSGRGKHRQLVKMGLKQTAFGWQD